MTVNPAYQTLSAANAQRTRWQVHIGAAATLLACVLWLFRADVIDAVRVWWQYPTYSHSFLIIPIVAWLIWERREVLRVVPPLATPAALLATLPVSLLWLAGHYAMISEIRQVAVVGLMQVILAATLGLSVYRRILFPALYLFFLVPTGEYLIPPLQRFTVNFTQTGLTLLHVPYFREGTLFELVNGRYEIAEACAGLRFLIATITLGVLFCYLMFRKWWKTVLFLAACIAVPVLGNGIRVLATILVANYTNNHVAAGVDHLVYGWGLAVAFIMLLLFVGSLFRDTADATPTIVVHPPVPESRFRVAITTVFALAGIGLAPAVAWAQLASAPRPNIAMVTIPHHLDHWSVAGLTGSWRPSYHTPDRELAFSMRPKERLTEPGVDVVVDYYGQAAADAQIAAKNHAWDSSFWHSIERRNVNGMLGDRGLRYSESRIDSNAEERLVWMTYWADDDFASDAVGLKWLQFKGGARGHYATAAIMLSTTVTTSVERARQRLSAASAALTDLPRELVASETQGH